MRVAKGLLHGFRASRVPLGIDYVGFVSRKDWEMTQISETNKMGRNQNDQYSDLILKTIL